MILVSKILQTTSGDQTLTKVNNGVRGLTRHYTVYQSDCTVQVLFSYYVEDRYAHDRTICILLTGFSSLALRRAAARRSASVKIKTNAHRVNRTRIRKTVAQIVWQNEEEREASIPCRCGVDVFSILLHAAGLRSVKGKPFYRLSKNRCLSRISCLRKNRCNVSAEFIAHDPWRPTQRDKRTVNG